MSSDEEDYMSDKFLSQCTQKDVRPGLIKNRARQREVEIATKKAKIDHENKIKSKPNEKERLQEGLGNAITEDNKGFALLAKMGYKQGQALGKASNGIVEPIAISIKFDRSGLGRDAAVRELNAKRQELMRKKMLEKAKVPQISIEEHRKRMMQKAKDSFVERAIRRLQLTCEKLDIEEKIEKPEIPWFWPERQNNEEEENDEEESCSEEIEFEPAEKLEMLSMYLRTSYNYCHWCGVQYDDIDDLLQNCPGPDESDH